jgi:hypothetical protein
MFGDSGEARKVAWVVCVDEVGVGVLVDVGSGRLLPTKP